MLRALPTAALAAASVLLAPSAQAVTEFDQNVTNSLIFGSGNDNGAFTTDRRNGVELGLRGKLRFNESNLPENTFNSNGDGTYTFQAGTPPTGYSFAPKATTPIWSFEWSINTDYDDTTGRALDDLTYTLSLDTDAGPGESFLSFDPINDSNPATGGLQWDHAIGDNNTLNGEGAKIPNSTSDASGYADLIANNNIAQNSWNYVFFFNDLATFDPNEKGLYTISLAAFDGAGAQVASTSIDVNVVPVPFGAVLIGSAFLVAGAVSARARRKAA